MDLFEDHFDRMQIAVSQTYSLEQLPRWITDHTKILGEPYSFLNHEFQEKIITDTSRVVNVSKCSQVGLSEVMARWTLGFCEVFPGVGAIVTFPFSGDAEDFARTRIDPIITASSRLQSAINPRLDNPSVKQIHESLLYFRGTNGKTQAISTPGDLIVSDEIDRSDPHILTQYESRLTHSPYKLRRNFSTPTIDGWGISLEMETSRRMRNLCKCNHCNNWFLPDYYSQVRIPGFTGDLRTITKLNLPRYRYMEAYLACPRCGLAPDLSPANREWVWENTNDNFEAAGYYVSPFDAPGFINATSLIKSSTSYSKRSEFDNQGLGQTSANSDEQLTLVDLNASKVITDLKSSTAHAMGIDMGLICHVTVGRMTLEGTLLVVHREYVPLGEIEKRKAALKLAYRVLITVVDSGPYTDTVMRMQAKDSSLFGGLYNDSKNGLVYEIKMFEGEASEGKLPIHLAKIHRNKAFDELMGLFKTGEIKIFEQDKQLDELYDKHALDMKRIQTFDSNMELTYVWMKSKLAQDHFFHSTLYLLAACKLRGVVAYKRPMLGAGMMPMQVRKIQRAETTRR